MRTARLIGIANAVLLTWPEKRPLVAAAVFMPITWPSEFDERTTGVAGLDRRGDLDHPEEGLGLAAARIAGGHLLVERGDRTGRDGRVAAATAGVADRDHRVADRDLRGIGEAHRVEIRHVVDLQERDVVLDVVAEHLGRVRLAGRDELDAHRGRVGDHVVVGEHLARRRDDHAGSGSLAAPAAVSIVV